MVPFSRIYIHRERTMIDLGQKKNCLNCSYFTLMLNTVNRGSTGKLLTTAEGKIKPFMPAKKCLPRLFLFSIALNIHVIYYLCLTELMCPFLWYVPSYSRYVFFFFFFFLTSIPLPPLHLSHIVPSLPRSHPSSSVSAPVSRLAKTTEGTSVIRVPARSHQFTLSLTDPCAAQYVKKRKKKNPNQLCDHLRV